MLSDGRRRGAEIKNKGDDKKGSTGGGERPVSERRSATGAVRVPKQNR